MPLVSGTVEWVTRCPRECPLDNDAYGARARMTTTTTRRRSSASCEDAMTRAPAAPTTILPRGCEAAAEE